ncbi:SPOR domain-containing protein [Rhodoferax sp. GW822-FHT02A01]|uniref:SPOR domain-containing protein n=1 Tax=Rhodoferax sp. GW822-FHT02A01 TaxID=3141537 RepID=UPI00315D1659
MAFFKLRKAGGEQPAPPPAPESVDAMRKRARYRLAGAALLVLAGVIGFPILFDNQPRPIAVDIPIDIPDKTKVKPLAASDSAPVVQQSQSSSPAASEPAPAPAAAPAPVAAPVTAPSPAPAAAPAKDSKDAKAPAKPAEKSKAADKEEVIIAPSKADAARDSKVTAKPVEKSADKPADKASDKSATGRFVVQFGAFTDSARAHEARLKVEKLGLKTYAQIAETPDGKKFRVRVGPFEKRSDAEKAAEKIQKAGLSVSILGL